MYLAYFDENKYSADNPFFLIGGLLISDKRVLDFERILSRIQYNFFGTDLLTKQTEIHGKDVFHGKGNCTGRGLEARVELFRDISTFLEKNEVPIRMVCIDVQKHREKYYYAEPEYRLGLMLFLERLCDFLDTVNDLGLVFGDYEKDEVAKSILDFSQFKHEGKTPMYYGRPLGRLVDTIHFAQSHHSRFLQVADVIVYMAGRYENGVCTSEKWHDTRVREIWEELKASVDIRIQRWP